MPVPVRELVACVLTMVVDVLLARPSRSPFIYTITLYIHTRRSCPCYLILSYLHVILIPAPHLIPSLNPAISVRNVSWSFHGSTTILGVPGSCAALHDDSAYQRVWGLQLRVATSPSSASHTSRWWCTFSYTCPAYLRDRFIGISDVQISVPFPSTIKLFPSRFLHSFHHKAISFSLSPILYPRPIPSLTPKPTDKANRKEKEKYKGWFIQTLSTGRSHLNPPLSNFKSMEDFFVERAAQILQ